MAARPMAYSTLDAIRAALSGDFNLSETVLISGQSQGASAAIATAGFAKDYAPKLSLAGLMVTGIPYLNASMADACEAGSHLVSKTYPEQDHSGGLLTSIPDTTEFAVTVLSGEVPASTCP